MKKIFLFFLAIFLAAGNSFPYYDEVKAADQKKDQIIIHVKCKGDNSVPAKVSVILDFESEKETEPLKGMSDENGIFKAEIPEETYCIMVKVSKESFIPKKIILSRKDKGAITGAEISVELDHGETIGGFLSTEGGQPISKAKIILLAEIWNGRNYDVGNITVADRSSEKYELISDEKGSWNCTIPSGNDDLSFLFEHPDIGMGVQRSISTDEDKDAAKALKDRNFKFVFSKPVQIKLKVLDETGNPVENSDVFISLNGQVDDLRLSTDKKGESCFSYQSSDCKDLPKIVVLKEGFVPYDNEVPISKTDEIKNIQLKKAVPVGGKVVDIEGNPIKGVRFARSFNFLLSDFVKHMTLSDQDGNFILSGVLPSFSAKYRVCSPEGYMDKYILSSDLASNPVVVLVPKIHIKAIIKDKAGNSLKNIRCFEYIDDDFNMRYEEIKDGIYERYIDEIKDGTGGQINFGLEVICRPYRKQMQKKIIKSGDKEVNFNFAMDDEGVKKGTILGTDGKPVGNIMIFFTGEKRTCLFDEQLNYKVDETVAFSSEDLRHIVSDASGNYEFYPSTPKAKQKQLENNFDNGIYEFYPYEYNNGRTILVTAFTNDGCLCIPIDEFDKTEKVQLQKYSKVEGDIFKGDKTIPKQSICLERIFIIGGEYHSVDLFTESDENGHFVFEKVPPGYFGISCHDEKLSIYGEAVPGVSHKVKLGGYGVRITGKLVPPPEIKVDFKDKESSCLNMFLQNDDEFSIDSEEKIKEMIIMNVRTEIKTELLPDGTFNAVDVPPGKYKIMFNAQDDGEIYAWTDQEFTITEDTLKKGEINLGLFQLK
ncbi:MAG TPA: hypothetical protein DET40_19945 [Lentisphaeria bacterium]|nr:MAG: hypothetical protein A2X45_00935 [Lentisphaerae bacterium GWF2_50_93]HCE45823.1 hypothetical protein [Lentisphaeria bacterium]